MSAAAILPHSTMGWAPLRDNKCCRAEKPTAHAVFEVGKYFQAVSEQLFAILGTQMCGWWSVP